LLRLKKKDTLIYSSQGTVGVGSSFKVETDFRARETLLLRELELDLEMNKSKTTTQKLGLAWHIDLNLTCHHHSLYSPWGKAPKGRCPF